MSKCIHIDRKYKNSTFQIVKENGICPSCAKKLHIVECSNCKKEFEEDCVIGKIQFYEVVKITTAELMFNKKCRKILEKRINDQDKEIMKSFATMSSKDLIDTLGRFNAFIFENKLGKDSNIYKGRKKIISILKQREKEKDD